MFNFLVCTKKKTHQVILLLQNNKNRVTSWIFFFFCFTLGYDIKCKKRKVGVFGMPGWRAVGHLYSNGIQVMHLGQLY